MGKILIWQKFSGTSQFDFNPADVKDSNSELVVKQEISKLKSEILAFVNAFIKN